MLQLQESGIFINEVDVLQILGKSIDHSDVEAKIVWPHKFIKDRINSWHNNYVFY